MNEKLLKLAEKLKEKEEKKLLIKDKYVKIGKVKKLSIEQRLARLEEMLGIE